MSQSDRAIKKFATQLARLDREVKSWRGAQADFTSIENGGNFTFKDGDGNVTAIMGGQDDGSNTIRHVDGPTPPVPSGLSAHVDGPIVQVSWDGTFEDADEATYDWSHLEVIAAGPNGENLRATINDVTGATANLAATASGEWTVVARSVSRAEKRSLDGDAGTVEVKLVDIDGAIEAVQDSANGKNKVTYSEHAPTPADPGIFDDTWFVGQVGRPNDIVEATNLIPNPSFETAATVDMAHANITLTNPTVSGSPSGGRVLRATMKAGSHGTYEFSGQYSANTHGAQWVAAALMSKPGAGNASKWRGVRLADTIIGGSTEYTNITGISDASGWTRQVATKQLRPNASYARFVLYYQGSSAMGSAPVAGDVFESDSWVVATGDSEASALAKIESYFDGDTPSGATDNEPHYRWTGTPHASTSEKYLPALDIGDSDNWNVIEQYRHDGTGWVKVELSHYVFSTVDLGKATVGELDGIRIMGQTIRGEQLSGDAIDGKVITGATYRTTGGTGSWSDAGLFIAQPDGTSMVRFPTDGTPLSLTASDTQIERASITDLDLSNGAVRSGGEFTLASGVTAPPSPPELTTGWQKTAVLDRPTYSTSYNWTGLASWGDKWVRVLNSWGEAGDSQDLVLIYNGDGTVNKAISVGLNPRHGLTVMGDIVYVFGAGHAGTSDRNFIDGYDLNTGERVSRHEYTRGIQAVNALGNDGTNLIIGSVYNLELWVHRRDPVTGVQVGSDMRSGSNSWPASGGKDLFGVRISGNDVEVVTSWGGRVYLNSNNVLVRKTDSANASGYAGWALPAHDVSGCDWINGAPYPMDSSGSVYQGSQFVSDKTVQMCFTWTNGTYETTPSPLVTFQAGAREVFTVSLPQRAGLAKRLYYRSGTSGSWVMKGVAEGTTVYVVSDVQGFAAPLPTVNSFPNADPATLKSTNDKFEVNGDGSGKWGPLTFNADGTMSSSAVPEWVPITTFASGFEPRSWGFAPAYRVWPDGKVEWRGVVSGSIPPSAITPILTVPSVARPPQPVNLPVAVSGSVGTPLVTRVEFGGLSTSTALTVMGNGDTLTWVALDGIHYYKD